MAHMDGSDDRLLHLLWFDFRPKGALRHSNSLDGMDSQLKEVLRGIEDFRKEENSSMLPP